jgi:hypothetical protein
MTAIKRIKLIVDTLTGTVMHEDRSAVSVGNAPSILLSEKILIELQYKAGTANFTGFNGVPLSSFAVIDNNFDLYIAQSLDSPITAGIPITEVKTVGIAPQRLTGVLTLTNADGDNESIEYTSHSTAEGVLSFKVSHTPIYTYAEGDQVRAIQAPIVSEVSVDLSGAATGLFVVSMDGNSSVFLDLIKGKSKLTDTYFTHVIMDSSDNSVLSAVVCPFGCKGMLAYKGITPPVLPVYDDVYVSRNGENGFNMAGSATGDLYYRDANGRVARLAKGADESKIYGIKWTESIPALVDSTPVIPPPSSSGTVSRVVGPLHLVVKNFFMNTLYFTRVGLRIEGDAISLISIEKVRIYANNLKEITGDADIPDVCNNEPHDMINDYDLWLGTYEVWVYWEVNAWKLKIYYHSMAYVIYTCPTLYGDYTVEDKSGTGTSIAHITPY